MTVDVIRWLSIVACAFSLMAFLRLYLEIGRRFLPKWPMRLLMASWGLFVADFAAFLHSRIGTEITWRSPAALVALGGQLVALVMLHRWYRSPAGQAHVDRMTRPRDDE